MCRRWWVLIIALHWRLTINLSCWKHKFLKIRFLHKSPRHLWMFLRARVEVGKHWKNKHLKHFAFRLNGDTFECEDIDECAVENGGCNHTFLTSLNILTFLTIRSDDFNHCHHSHHSHTGGCHHTCVNTPGGVNCRSESCRVIDHHRLSPIVIDHHQLSSITICPPLHSCQQQLLGWLSSRCSVLIQSLEWRSVAPSFNVCHHPLNTTMYCSIASMHWITPY